MTRGYLSILDKEDSILRESQAWSGFAFLVGFLIVFRTSQAYNRFWDGCTATHQMRAEWFDACAALVSFCQHSSVDKDIIEDFKQTLIRLFSMLHAAALAELEEKNPDTSDPVCAAFEFDLIDAEAIDETSLKAIKESDAKVELIFAWIQLLIVENINTGVLSIAPPILSRAFQEIANGMVAFHDAIKIAYIPFPFPYAQTCDCLLVLHWLVIPLVTTQWVTYPHWAAIFVFIQVFILWSLNFIAVEIENPFGRDMNDIDANHMQEEMNKHLILLLKSDTLRIPHLADRTRVDTRRTKSFIKVWSELGVSSNHSDDFPPDGRIETSWVSCCLYRLRIRRRPKPIGPPRRQWSFESRGSIGSDGSDERSVYESQSIRYTTSMNSTTEETSVRIDRTMSDGSHPGSDNDRFLAFKRADVRKRTISFHDPGDNVSVEAAREMGLRLQATPNSNSDSQEALTLHGKWEAVKRPLEDAENDARIVASQSDRPEEHSHTAKVSWEVHHISQGAAEAQRIGRVIDEQQHCRARALRERPGSHVELAGSSLDHSSQGSVSTAEEQRALREELDYSPLDEAVAEERLNELNCSERLGAVLPRLSPPDRKSVV